MDFTDDPVLQDLNAFLSQEHGKGPEEDESVTIGGSQEELNEHRGESGCNDDDYLPNYRRWPEIRATGTRVNIVPVLLDDSSSIKDRGNIKKLFSGVKLMSKAFYDLACRGKETFISFDGFSERYFCGNIKKFHENIRNILSCVNFEHATPLVETSIQLVNSTKELEKNLHSRGIATRTSMLILTDGEPMHDSYCPDDFVRFMKECSSWRFTGMGIARSIDNGYAEDVERDKRQFTNLFLKMGISRENIMTPSSSKGELERAFYRFSRSVSLA